MLCRLCSKSSRRQMLAMRRCSPRMLLWWLVMGAIQHNAHVSGSLARGWLMGAAKAAGIGLKSDVCRHAEHGDDCRLLARVRGGNDTATRTPDLDPPTRRYWRLHAS